MGTKGSKFETKTTKNAINNKRFLFTGANRSVPGGGADDSGHSCTIGSEIYLDVSYLHYLHDARRSISSCLRACRVWSAPYDGQDPPPDRYQPGVLKEPLLKAPQPQGAARKVPHPPPSTNTDPASGKPLELEWDDSYDACPVQTAEAGEGGEPAPPAEPPKHIQEMRKTATMLVKGSYVEENDFQDDVMVYDLVAKKDTRDWELKSNKTASRGAPSGSAEAPPETGARPALAQNSRAALDSKPQNGAAAELRDDLLAQYEDLLRTLDTGAGGKPVPAEEESRKAATSAAEEEEEEMDFFIPETPEAEKVPPPFGKLFSGSVGRSQAAPFTGQSAGSAAGKRTQSPAASSAPTGPFVSVLLSRMENMLSNSLHVNLLLTGILAQLAAFPQPLLRAFLLNTNLVFQPSVRSLFQVGAEGLWRSPFVHFLQGESVCLHVSPQVLATVKQQIEEVAAARGDFPELITAAQHWLLAREASFTGTSVGEHSENRATSDVFGAIAATVRCIDDEAVFDRDPCEFTKVRQAEMLSGGLLK